MKARDVINALADKYVPAIYQRVAGVLETKSTTVRVIASEINADHKTVSQAIRNLRAAGLVRVARYKRATHSGPFTPYYALGSAPDAEKPHCYTPAERRARWQAKGGDPHAARKLRTAAKRELAPAGELIARNMTLAGLLGVNTK